MEFHLHRHPSERLNELVFCAVFSKCHWLLLYLKEVTRVYHSLYWNEPVSFASNDPSVQESFSILAVIKWGSHAGKVQLQVFGVGSQRTVDPPWSADSPGVLLKGSVLPWHHMSVQDLLHCATKTPANRSVPTALQAGCCPPPPPLPTQCWGAWKFQLDRREIFSSELKGLKILSCQREKKGRRVVGYGKGGTVWNLRWQDLCGVSLLGTNKPQDDLIFKTCWTCWQNRAWDPHCRGFVCCYWLHFNCLVIVFVFLEFAFLCNVPAVLTAALQRWSCCGPRYGRAAGTPQAQPCCQEGNSREVL